jgi:hypothetical protein
MTKKNCKSPKRKTEIGRIVTETTTAGEIGTEMIGKTDHEVCNCPRPDIDVLLVVDQERTMIDTTETEKEIVTDIITGIRKRGRNDRTLISMKKTMTMMSISMRED